MTRTHFIHPHERLIALSAKDGYSTIFDDIIDTVEEATALIGTEAEFVTKIIRLDALIPAAEDISEQIAESYINQHAAELHEESIIEPFIENSKAWDEHIAHLAQEAADDARFGTYEEQHRLRVQDVL